MSIEKRKQERLEKKNKYKIFYILLILRVIELFPSND